MARDQNNETGDSPPEEAFFEAARKGDLATIERLLLNSPASKLNINAVDKNGNNALQIVAGADIRSYDAVHIIHNLIDAGVDLLHTNKAGNTVADIAHDSIAKGHQFGREKADAVNDGDAVQFLQSVFQGTEERTIAFLEKQKSAANRKYLLNLEVADGVNVLMYAAGNDNADTVQAMVDALKDDPGKLDYLNEVGLGGHTALHAALNDSRSYDILKKAGAKDDIENEDGATPHELRERAIEKRGAGGFWSDPSWDNEQGFFWNLLNEMAIGLNSLLGGFKPGHGSHDYAPPATYSPAADDTSATRPPTADESMEQAIYSGDEARAVSLLAKGANAAGGFSNNISFLLYAAASGLNKLVKALLASLEKSGDLDDVLNAKGINGMTPLLAAAFDGNSKLVDILLAKGADPTAKDELLGVTARNALIAALDADDTTPLHDILKKRASANDAPYRPGRHRFRNWLFQHLSASQGNSATETVTQPPVESPVEQGGSGSSSSHLTVIEGDPEGVAGANWVNGVQNNQQNMDRVLGRAQELLDELNRVLGTDYQLTHNFNLANFGAENAENVPLFIGIGNRVIGAIPQEGFIDRSTLYGDTLRDRDFAEDRSHLNTGGVPEGLSMRQRSAYILNALSGYVNIARATDGWRTRMRGLFEHNRVNYTLERRAVTRSKKPSHHTDAFYQNFRGSNFSLLEYNPFTQITSETSGLPSFMRLAHETAHAWHYGDGDTSFGLRPGDFDGQTGVIDGMDVVWRAKGQGGRWHVRYGRFGEIAIDELRAMGVGPYQDTSLYEDTENAVLEAYGFPYRTYYSNPNERLVSPSRSNPRGMWGGARDPWNQPGWVPPPPIPTGVTHLSKTSIGPPVRPIKRSEEELEFEDGEEGTLEELQDAAGDERRDEGDGPLEELQDDGDELEFTDFTEVINRRYRDDEDMPASMEQAADDWLKTYKGSREEFEKTYENILDNEDAWSNEELEALAESGALKNRALLSRAVSAILYEREGVARVQDYENALNGLAVWIRDQDANGRAFPNFDEKAKGYLKTIVHYEMRLFELEKGMNKAYHEGEEHLLDKLPSLIAKRVENAFADDGNRKYLRFAARDKVREVLKDDASPQHRSMASLILTEYGNFTDWARVFHADEIDTGSENRYRGAPGS